jgi:hypothetical protein
MEREVGESRIDDDEVLDEAVDAAVVLVRETMGWSSTSRWDGGLDVVRGALGKKSRVGALRAGEVEVLNGE